MALQLQCIRWTVHTLWAAPVQSCEIVSLTTHNFVGDDQGPNMVRKGILYHFASDKTLCLFPPTAD